MTTPKVFSGETGSPETIPGCFGDYDDPCKPNNCQRCKEKATCSAKTELLKELLKE